MLIWFVYAVYVYIWFMYTIYVCMLFMYTGHCMWHCMCTLYMYTCCIRILYMYVYILYLYTGPYPLHVTGWRRLIGSPKLQIIFHKRVTKYRSLLRKMTYKDKGSYESSPPCTRSMPLLCARGVEVANLKDFKSRISMDLKWQILRSSSYKFSWIPSHES